MTTATQNYYGNMSVAEIAKEDEQSRNLKQAQIKYQKQQQSTNDIERGSRVSNINTQNKGLASTGQAGVQNKRETNSQKKAYFKRLQNRYAKKRSAKLKNKLLIRRYAKDIKRYEKTPWIIMYAAVAGNVLGGMLTWAGIGYLFIVPCTLFIDVMVWKSLSKKDRTQIRLKMVGATAIKFIPIIGAFPASLLLVNNAKKIAHKRMKNAENKIKKLSMI